jgi:Flp pilus assembly protein TadG
MEPAITYLKTLVHVLYGRLRELRHDERGSLTLEQVVIASVLFVAAVALVAVIVAVIKSYQGKITAPGGQ